MDRSVYYAIVLPLIFGSAIACKKDEAKTEYVYVDREVEKIVYVPADRSNDPATTDPTAGAGTQPSVPAPATAPVVNGESGPLGDQSFVAGALALDTAARLPAGTRGFRETVWVTEPMRRVARLNLTRSDAGGCEVDILDAVSKTKLGTVIADTEGRFVFPVADGVRVVANANCGGARRSAVMTPQKVENGMTVADIKADSDRLEVVDPNSTVIAAYAREAIDSQIGSLKSAIDLVTDPVLKQALWSSMLKAIDMVVQKKVKEIETAIEEGTIVLSDSLINALATASANGSSSINDVFVNAGVKEPSALSASRASDAAYLETMKACSATLGGSVKTCSVVLAKILYGMGFPVSLRISSDSALLTQESECDEGEEKLAGFPSGSIKVLSYADEFSKYEQACLGMNYNFDMCNAVQTRVWNLPAAAKWDNFFQLNPGRSGEKFCLIRPMVQEVDRNANFHSQRSRGDGKQIEEALYFSEAAADPSDWSDLNAANEHNAALTGLAYAMIKGHRYKIDDVADMLTTVRGEIKYNKTFWVAGFNNKFIGVEDDADAWFRVEIPFVDGEFRRTPVTDFYKNLSPEQQQWDKWNQYSRLGELIHWMPGFDAEGRFEAAWQAWNAQDTSACGNNCTPEDEASVDSYTGSVVNELKNQQAFLVDKVKEKMLVFNGLTREQIGAKLDTTMRHDAEGNPTGSSELQVIYNGKKARQLQQCEKNVYDFNQCFSIDLQQNCWDNDVSTPCFSKRKDANGDLIAYDAVSLTVTRNFDASTKSMYYAFSKRNRGFGLTMRGDDPTIVQSGQQWNAKFRVKDLKFSSATFTADDYFLMAEMECNNRGCFPSGVYRLMNARTGNPLLDEDFSPLMLVSLTGACDSDYEKDLFATSGTCTSGPHANKFILVKVMTRQWNQEKQRDVFQFEIVKAKSGEGSGSAAPFVIPELDLSATKSYELNWGRPEVSLSFQDGGWSNNYRLLGYQTSANNRMIMEAAFDGTNITAVPAAFSDNATPPLAAGKKFVLQTWSCDVSFAPNQPPMENDCEERWFLVGWDDLATGKDRLLCHDDPSWPDTKMVRLPIDLWRDLTCDQSGCPQVNEQDAFWACRPLPDSLMEQISNISLADYDIRNEWRCDDNGCGYVQVNVSGKLREFAIRVEQSTGPAPNLGFDPRRAPFFIDLNENGALDTKELPFVLNNRNDIGANSWVLREIALRTASNGSGVPYWPNGWADYWNANVPGFPESCREVAGQDWYWSKSPEQCDIINQEFARIKGLVKKNDNVYAFPRKTAIGKLLSAAFQPDSAGKLVIDTNKLNALQAFALIFLYRESQVPILFRNVDTYDHVGAPTGAATLRLEQVDMGELPFFNSKIGNMFHVYRSLD
jgi:hypothetical protein